MRNYGLKEVSLHESAREVSGPARESIDVIEYVKQANPFPAPLFAPVFSHNRKKYFLKRQNNY